VKLNPLVVLTAVVYGLGGLALTFAPVEVLTALGAAASPVEAWVGQLLGGALMALGWLNWVQRYAVVGGVLGRPLLLTNLLFLLAAFGSSLRTWREDPTTVALVLTGLSGALGAAYGLRLVRAPAAGP
jgi:hypothetical protein